MKAVQETNVLSEYLRVEIAKQVEASVSSKYLGKFIDFQTEELEEFLSKRKIFLNRDKNVGTNTNFCYRGRVIYIESELVNGFYQVRLYVEFGKPYYANVDGYDTVIEDMVIRVDESNGWRANINCSLYKD